MKKIAIYPGSFDPITWGHLSIINRAKSLFDELIIAVAFNERKKGALFSLDERLQHLNTILIKDGETRIKVETFNGLLVDFASERNACAIIRGIRNAQDAAYEEQMIHMNRKLSGIETLLLFSTPEVSYLSSSLVKEVARNGGDVSSFVPPEILPLLLSRLTDT